MPFTGTPQEKYLLDIFTEMVGYMHSNRNWQLSFTKVLLR